jgi:hypothetical protein
MESRMKISCALGLLSFAGAVFANPLPAEHWFTKRLLNSEEKVRITEATFDDHFCFHVKGFASDGEHMVEIAVYDASGREVARVFAPVQARGATWQRAFCPGPTVDVDVPGEWWFVVTLDDAPVTSASIQISFGKPKPGIPTKKSPPRDPRARSR